VLVGRRLAEQSEAAFVEHELRNSLRVERRVGDMADLEDVDGAQAEFIRLTDSDNLRAAVALTRDGTALWATVPDWRGSPMDWAAFGLSPEDRAEVVADILTGQAQSRITHDRRGLVVVRPVGAPGTRLDRGTLVLHFDQTRAQAAVQEQFDQRFPLMIGSFAVGVVVLGAGLHVAVTRRIERVHDFIGRFAVGEPVTQPRSRWKDEIGQLEEAVGEFVVSVQRETAARQETEQALRLSTRRFQSAMLHSPIGMAMIDPDGWWQEVNPALCQIAGYTREELLGLSVQAVTYPEDLPDTLLGIHWLTTRQVDTYSAEKRLIHKDGDAVWVQLNMSVVWDEAGRPSYLVLQIQDIHVRKKAAAEMQALNERYARHGEALATLTRSHVEQPEGLTAAVREIAEVVARTLDVARVSVWRPDDRGSAHVCLDLCEWPGDRHSAGAVRGGPAFAAYSRTLSEADMVAAVDSGDDARTAAFAAEYLEPAGVMSVLHVPVRSQGRLVGVLCCEHIEPRLWTPDEQTFAVAVANLLSSLFAQVERQALEAELRQSRKLEGIGQLAGGVAHDFNNVLTVILGKAGRLVQDRRMPDDLREAAVEIWNSGERAASLTRQLLAFSRHQRIEMRDADLNEVVGGVARMLDRVLGEHVEVRLSFTSRPVWARIDRGLIDQVVLNLAVNARDAMPGGGSLTIETSIVDLDAAGAARHGREPGSYVCLSVADTGTGIAPEHLPHIFEPFFTTKEVGKGTGLGLASTYGIVQQHGGWIDIESQVGGGTTFRIHLPRLPDDAARQAAPLAPLSLDAPAPGAGRGETILVVEDEEAVRALLVDALEQFGYRVLEAPSGPRALEVAAREEPGIDLLVTDVVMPDGMNGVELATRLRRTAPNLRVVLISGYLADVSQGDLLETEGITYLAKPFSLPELARVARRCLDVRPAAADVTSPAPAFD
jgi:PAS domain S-box-containing protein